VRPVRRPSNLLRLTPAKEVELSTAAAVPSRYFRESNVHRNLTRASVATAAALSLSLLAACSLGGTESDGAESSKQVVVATHESWNMSKQVLKEFTDETGYVVKVEPVGDAGALTNRLVLTKNSPIADVVFGIDNTFASRAYDEGILAEYEPDTDPGERFDPSTDAMAGQLTAVDYSDVCVNVDDTWFAEKGLEPPTDFEDLAQQKYRGLFVTSAPTTSSPGLAFLLATVARFGEDGWRDYWERLASNDLKITAGWSDAYQVDFTAGGGSGDRPIVLSYASSPPFTIPEGSDEPTTSALLDTCFRQVEYAALLEGAENPEGAKAFIDFMVGTSFQKALPDNMYVFPVDSDVELPDAWASFAPTADTTWQVEEDAIADNRDAWLREWSDAVGS
jgi:thiamine transport system substrate-binding protein